MSIPLRTTIVLALLATGACKGPTDTPPVAGPPARITRVVEPATAVVNDRIEVAVRVTDQRGMPVPDVFVKWVGADGSSATAIAPTSTDADGQARADWWIGSTAKRYTLSAHAMVGEGAEQRTAAVTTFSVVATAPPAN